MSLHSVTQKRSQLTFEMKLLEHSRLAANKEAFFSLIGSAALLMLEVTSAKRGRGWCICNVIMLNPSLIGAWNSQLQSAWERAIELVFHCEVRPAEPRLPSATIGCKIWPLAA